MHRFRTLLRAIGTAVLTLAFLLCLVVAFGSITGRWRVAPVLSASMTPTFDPGSVVVLTPKDKADLEVGDILAFSAPVGDRAPTVHRIIEVERDGNSTSVRTQGDANNREDPWLAEVGGSDAWVVSQTVPHVGWAAMWMRSINLLPIILIGLAIIFVTYGLPAIWRQPGGRHLSDAR